MRVEGTKKLISALNKAQKLEFAKNAVKYHGSKLNSTMTRNAIFVKGYSKGDTKKSISLEIVDDGLTAIVAPHTHYSPYLEYGTRKMSAQPFVMPSLQQVKPGFLKEISKIKEL